MEIFRFKGVSKRYNSYKVAWKGSEYQIKMSRAGNILPIDYIEEMQVLENKLQT